MFVNFLMADILSLKDAEVGKCYEKVIIPAKIVSKDELVEISKQRDDYEVQEAKFKDVKKEIVVFPSFENIKTKDATFEKVDKNITIEKAKVYFSVGKKSLVPVSHEYQEFVKMRGVELDKLKEGECSYEFVRFKNKTKEKEYVSKQAYEIIDVAPAKFKTLKRKILIKPAFEKIVKTPAKFETKVIKLLVSPSYKEYKTVDKKVCVRLVPAKYQYIIKKILIKPAYTNIVKFPAQYKEIEVKELVSKPVVTRRVIPPKKSKISVTKLDIDKFFWSSKDIKNAKKTGLSICKKTKPKYSQSVKVLVVKSPATTYKNIIPAKKKVLVIKQKLSDGVVKKVSLPSQFEKIKSKMKLKDSTIVWREVKCTKH